MRKQIYMKAKINESKKSDAYELACMPQIKDYIVSVLGYPETSVFLDDGSVRMSPLMSNFDASKARDLSYGDDEAIVRFHEAIASNVPNFEQYTWFIFHTGYMNSNGDICVVKRNKIKEDLHEQWAIQNIEIKRYASSYLFQPKFNCTIRGSDGTLEIDGLSHAYLDQFAQSTKKLEQIIMNAIWNDPSYQKAITSITNAFTVKQWLTKFMNGAKSKNLMVDVEIPNVEELVKTFYFDGYDMNRQVTIFQIGNGKNARLFKVSNVKSTPMIDPLKLIPKCNPFSSAFNTILLSVQVRDMNGKYNVYGKIRFSNKKANKIGSFAPGSELPL